jgi:large repetitive protein
MPSDSGDYLCIIQSGTCPPVSTNICKVTVNPTPTASITFGTTNQVCINDPSSVKISGTAGAKVTYTIDNGTPKTAILDATGKVIIPTGNLKANVTYTLTKVETAQSPICSRTYNQSITIIVNPKPEIKLEDAYICIDPITGTTERPYLFDTKFDPVLYSFVWYKANVIQAGETNSTYLATAVGTYKVKVTEKATGCSSSDTAAILSSSKPLTASVAITTDYFSDNATIVVTATPVATTVSSTNTVYEYALDYGPFQDSNVFEGVQNGNHEVTVRDKQICGDAKVQFLIVDYPKFFTPNGDGYNDTWKISSLSNQPNAKIYIFDRFGKLIKQISTQGEWDGSFVGNPAPADDYWFVIQYEENQINKEFKAHFSLKR